MALSKGGKAGNNVSKLDDARTRSTKSNSSPQSASAKDDEEHPTTAPQLTDSKADKPAPKAKSSKQRVSNRRFDKVKVERLKSEIANGEYQIDYFNVADRFIEHERYA